MTVTIKEKRTKAGKTYLYLQIAFKDPLTGKWRHTDKATGLLVKGNRRQAEKLRKEAEEKYKYLEEPLYATDQLYPDMSVTDYFNYCLEKKRGSITENTYDTYRGRLNSINKYFDERNYLLQDITPKVLNDFWAYALLYGKTSQKDGSRGPLSARSVQSYKSLLYPMFKDAVINGLISANPSIDTTVTNVSKDELKEQMLFLTQDEIVEMLAYLKAKKPFLVPFAFFGAYYGMRRGEVCGLKWSAIDFHNRRLTIRHTVTGSGRLYKKDRTKTYSGYRTLNLFSTAEKCLMKMQADQTTDKLYYKSNYQNADNYIFVQPDGQLYNPDHVTKTFSKAMDNWGRPEITFHKLRYTCVSLLIDKGWDLKKIQYWIGDKDAATVLNIYAQYIKHKSNIAENDLEQMSQASAFLF